MALAEIDVGPLPPGVRAIVVDYRAVGESTYIRLGETAARVSRWSLPADYPVLVRARFRDAAGRVGPGIEERFEAASVVSDRPAMSALDIPEPIVKQADGPALEIVQDVPTGSDPKEFQVEVAQALSDATNPKDGLHIGYAEPGEAVKAHAWDGGQTVWTRLVRLADNRTSDWSSVVATTAAPPISPTAAHTNDYASGTIAKWGGSSNPASMEVSGGDLRHKAIYAGDIGGYAGDLTDIYAGDMGLRWPGRYTTANVALAANESIMVQWQPDFTSITRPTRYAGSWWEHAGGPPRFHTDTIAPGAAGEPVDLRFLRDNLTAGGGDEMPARIEASIATSSTASPTFAAADFTPLVPGKVYHDVNTYAVRFDVRNDYDRLVTIDNLYVWHWIWCRSRPWHTHSDAGELVFENTLVSDEATATASITGQNWDELRVEVDWKNADANPSQLYVRFNSDSGNNYHKNGAAGASSMLCGTGTLASGWYERVMFRMPRVKSGLERFVILESGGRWSTTTSEAPDAATSVMWDNTADGITTIVFGGTAGATPLASGSRFRVWGRRHHEE